MAATSEAHWALVVPVKHSSVAKSRLATYAGALRPDLARAMAQDCVVAALASLLVRAVVVVTDDDRAAASARRAGAVVVADEPAAGLNAALRHGESVARRLVPSVGALSADLAALRPRELTAALSAAPRDRLSFVADAAGSGTTLLLAPNGIALETRFGASSAAAHRASGAVQLDASAWPSLGRDVDTENDVRAALRLGIGPHTAQVLAHLHAGSDAVR